MSDKYLMFLCSLNAQKLKIMRHIPFLNKYAKAKKYGNCKILSIQDGRKILINAIQKGEPFMAARFGTSEGAALYSYWKNNKDYNKSDAKVLDTMCTNAGFFPHDFNKLCLWSEQETKACAKLDLLGVMNFFGEEYIYRKFCNNASLMPAGGLASSNNGWAWALKGKKVLVVHPFADTIMKQYTTNREKIFSNSDALPLFDLNCIKAVQTVADEVDDRFNDWFEALDYMTEEISKQDFDIALIGCGAYGFQLAARVKEMGKIAIHMGGCLQTLFGIKGGRWDTKYAYMYNDAWVYPSEEETPKGFEKVENGCYWGK